MKRTALWLVVTAVAVVPVYLLAAQGSPAPATTRPAPPGPARGAAPAGTVRTVELAASDVGGKYVFNPATINAKPGERIRLVIKGVGTMPKMASAHNFVLLKLGTNVAAFVNEGATAGAAAGYIPAAKKDAVLAQTPLVGGGETLETTFTVPAAPGVYPYICTFPGHYMLGMRGTLAVK